MVFKEFGEILARFFIVNGRVLFFCPVRLRVLRRECVVASWIAAEINYEPPGLLP